MLSGAMCVANEKHFVHFSHSLAWVVCLAYYICAKKSLVAGLAGDHIASNELIIK